MSSMLFVFIDMKKKTITIFFLGGHGNTHTLFIPVQLLVCSNERTMRCSSTGVVWI